MVTNVLMHTPLHASTGKLETVLLANIVFMLITTMLQCTKANLPAELAQPVRSDVLLQNTKLNIEPRRIKIDHNEKELQLAMERKAV